MFHKIILIFSLSLLLISCSKKDNVELITPNNADPYILYKEGYKAFEDGDFFYAEKKFSEAELNFEIVDLSAKSSIMASFALYSHKH